MPFLFVEFRAQLDGSRRGVDLVVDGDELSRLPAASAVCVVGLDLEPFALVALLQHLGQVVLSQGENYGDGLDLRDHDKRSGGVGRDQVAGIDEAQSNPAVDG